MPFSTARFARPALCSAVLLALAAPPAAGGGSGKLWTVDNKPGASADFSDVQAAVDAAQNGDTIRVRASPTPYAAPTILAKSLALVGSVGHGETVDWRGVTRISGIGPGQLVVLDGLYLEGLADQFPPPPTFPALSIDACTGSVWISDCELVGNPQSPGLSVTSSVGVVLDRVIARGGYGLSGSPITHTYGGPGGPALELHASRVSVHGSQLVGGDCGEDSVHYQSAPWPCDGGAGGSAARLVQSSELSMLGGSAKNGWTKDMYATLGVFHADASSLTRVSAVALSVNTGCTVYLPFVGPHEDWGVSFRQLLPPPLVLEPPAATLLASGLPGDAVVLLAAASADLYELPGVYGLLHLASPFFVVGAKLLPASPPAAHPFTFPIAAPSTPGQYASLCFQAAFVDASGAALLVNPALVKVPL